MTDDGSGASAVLSADLCVIGAGEGARTAAAGAAQLGASVVLAESGDMEPGHRYDAALLAARAGISRAVLPTRLAEVAAGIAPEDPLARFSGLGIARLPGKACFTSPELLLVGDRPVRAKRFIIATGSRPRLPAIAGLERTPCLTAATIHTASAPIEHLLVIGAGATGTELAQAQSKLGARVTLVDMARLLPQEDPDLVAPLRAVLAANGISLREGVGVTQAGCGSEGGVELSLADKLGVTETLRGSHLLVATGRVADTGTLGLDVAGVECQEGNIKVDERLRTSNPRIHAIGECTGAPAAAHVARYHAGIALRNILFRWPAKVAPHLVPRLLLTDPELAYVGLSESAARARFKDVRVEQLPLGASERAQMEQRLDGRIKLVLRAQGQILGVGIVGPQAGELLAPWCLALGRGLKLSSVAGLLLPYPTLSEISKRVAGNFYAPRLSGPGVRAIVRGLLRFA